MAIGTAAVAVAVNTAIGLAVHMRGGNVNWECSAVFAMLGAALGAELGKAVDGGRLLVLFAVLMVSVGLLTMRERKGGSDPDVRLQRSNARILLPRLIPAGFGVGGLAGAVIGRTALTLLNARGRLLKFAFGSLVVLVGAAILIAELAL